MVLLNPGAAATDAITQVLAERAAQRQRDLLLQHQKEMDVLANQREERIALDADLNRQMNVDRIKQTEVDRTATEKDRRAAAWEKRRTSQFTGGSILTSPQDIANGLEFGGVNQVQTGIPTSPTLLLNPSVPSPPAQEGTLPVAQGPLPLAPSGPAPTGYEVTPTAAEVRQREADAAYEKEVQAAPPERQPVLRLAATARKAGNPLSDALLTPKPTVGRTLVFNSNTGTIVDKATGQPVTDARPGDVTHVQHPPQSQAGAVPDIGAAFDPNAPHGEAFLATIPKDAATVKALAEGRMPWPIGTALRAPEWAQKIQEVFQYDPTMDVATINQNARAKVRQDFTSGKTADQITSLNRVVGHLQQLDNLIGALDNKDMRLYNVVANAIMRNVSNWSGQNDFETVSGHLAEELTRAWRGTGGNESDIRRELNTLDANRPPSVLHNAVGNIAHLIGSQFDSITQRQRQGLGIGAVIPVASPESQQRLSELSKYATVGGSGPPSVGQAPSPAPPQAGQVIDAAAFMAARKKGGG